MPERNHGPKIPAARRHLFGGAAALAIVTAAIGMLLSSSSSLLSPGAAITASVAHYKAERKLRQASEGNAFVPSVLSGDDALQYRKMFRLARAGKAGEAKELGALLSDSILLDQVFSRGPGRVDAGIYTASREERRALVRRPLSKNAKPVERVSANAHEPKGGAAAEMFFAGKVSHAYTLARAQLAGEKDDPESSWLAGLAAWRLEEFHQAARHFADVAHGRKVDDWRRAAGGFWAARAFMRSNQPAQVNRYFSIAAGYPRTFYGLLATRALGLEPKLNWRIPQLDKAAIERIASLPAGRRALALLQVGENDLAEQELRALAEGANRELTQSILAVAAETGMAELLYRLGNKVRDADGLPYDTALYPLPSWRPLGGFGLDRALIFGVMRQESQFRTDALSPAGARGLMQIMPATASFISKDKSLEGGKRDQLYNAEFNIKLGQQYIDHLLDQKEIAGNLFLLAAAYNGGIGNVARWRREMDLHDDPLMFIESIPFAETRLYVERVLTNIWMYRIRLDQPAPSLDRLAAGKWPDYRAVEANLEGASTRVMN